MSEYSDNVPEHLTQLAKQSMIKIHHPSTMPILQADCSKFHPYIHGREERMQIACAGPSSNLAAFGQPAEASNRPGEAQPAAPLEPAEKPVPKQILHFLRNCSPSLDRIAQDFVRRGINTEQILRELALAWSKEERQQVVDFFDISPLEKIALENAFRRYSERHRAL